MGQNTNSQVNANATGSSESIADDVSLRIMLEKVSQVRENFTITEKLGEGTFSKVYKAVRRSSSDSNTTDELITQQQPQQLTPPNSDPPEENNITYALKYITPIVKPGRVAKEIRFLRDLQGQANVVPLLGCLYAAGHTVLVMPIIEHERFQDFFQRIDADRTREYMRNLFLALNHVHRLGIVHRDIKPANILYHPGTGRFSLVDFGLSQTQKELDATGFAAAGIAAGHGSLVGSRSAPPVRPGDPSRVRSNLSMRFTANDACMMQHASNQPRENSHSKASAASVCRRNLTVTLTKLSPKKKEASPVKNIPPSKRPHEDEEAEKKTKEDKSVPIEGQIRVYDSPVKRQRISGTDFIERVVGNLQQQQNSTSTVFSTPKTGGGGGDENKSSLSLYVPETPVKGGGLQGLRTPLGNRDSNQGGGGGGGVCTAATTSIAPPRMNFGAFTTPTKPTSTMAEQQARTPVKGSTAFHHEKMMFIPETPPKTVQKNLIFASSAKSALKAKVCLLAFLIAITLLTFTPPKQNAGKHHDLHEHHKHTNDYFHKGNLTHLQQL